MPYPPRMRRPSPALVIALIALFFSLAGTGWAVTQLPRNSVGSPQIKANAVTGPKVKDGSLSAADFAAGTLLTGATGATGPQGERGPQGEQGLQGIQGLQGVLATLSVTQRNPAGVTGTGSTVGSSSPAEPAAGPCTDNCRVSTGPIVVTQQSRIIASAQVAIRNTSGSTKTIACYIVRDVGGGFSDLTYASTATATIADATVATLSLTAAIDASAGSYNLALRCGDANSPNPSTLFTADEITITAFAVAR